MKVLITGATGFIGKRLVQRLLQNHIEVVCTGRSLSKLDHYIGRVNILYLDIRDKEKVEDVFKKERPNLVFHCAANTTNNSLRILRRTNVQGTKNVLDACLEAGVDKVVYLSSISVIAGNKEACLNDCLPYKARNRYGRSKIAAEKLAREYRKRGLEISILRPSLVYGERDYHKVSLMVRLISKRLIPIAGRGENEVSLTYIENLIDVMMIAIDKKSAYKGTYIVADKETISFKDLFLYIAKLLEIKKSWFLPDWLVSIFAYCPFVGGYAKVFLENNICSIDRIKNQLNYIPKISLYEGLRRTVDEHKKRYKLKRNY
ncbi:MAG: NAD(P)-dependent oxidoreductase [Candidatus Omnitrophica bacterium]|nr:NAD(P)-dependent oxidoreductase [Candidatus Omnitrophota bacterium]MCF7876731.1 NAD(P)-dependent oxidoreductase [Candidatus Omnitrophota bacterium]MCF7891464.1 NAD(P)-dependent oxidoreductase [Candidatus Omnitrophota bacterium]MCF7895400.1 NAD(P)-dependent oxidoreductase [Candidatus Omnitrophota bacterium]MCF7897164.1 NAD(P)-dependent oxidoreductase [Candidatus Omnitrophota bacterium]